MKELNDYQLAAARTLPPNDNPRDALILGALGLGGEAGEAIDLIKKHIYHQQPLDVAKLKKELGDVLWYLAAIATGAGVTLEQVAESNVAKLKARYPEGFSPEASVVRADERERIMYGVTPPQSDTVAFRSWLESEARGRGFTDLEWESAVDKHGAPYMRLFARRP